MDFEPHVHPVLTCKFCAEKGKISRVWVDIQYFRNGQPHLPMHCTECKRFLEYRPQKEIQDLILGFGQYEGQTIKDVCEHNPRYLLWTIRQGFFKKNKAAQIKAYIQKRLFGFISEEL